MVAQSVIARAGSNMRPQHIYPRATSRYCTHPYKPSHIHNSQPPTNLISSCPDPTASRTAPPSRATTTRTPSPMRAAPTPASRTSPEVRIRAVLARCGPYADFAPESCRRRFSERAIRCGPAHDERLDRHLDLQQRALRGPSWRLRRQPVRRAGPGPVPLRGRPEREVRHVWVRARWKHHRLEHGRHGREL